jgi:hypothetical protein
LNENLDVSGDSTTKSLVVSNDTVIKGPAVVGTIIDKDALFSVYGDVIATGDLSGKNMTLGNNMLVKGDSTFSHDARVNGNLTVDGYIYGHAATFDADTSYQGSLTVGSTTNNSKQVNVYSPTTIDNNVTINKNLTVLGTLNANINISYTYTARSASTSPNWCRIMTINMISSRFSPLKFNILGSRPASGWGTWFDGDYYFQPIRDTLVDDLSNTYYYYANRTSNYPCATLQLSFVRTSLNELDVYMYRDYGDIMNGTILFNKLPAVVITTYSSVRFAMVPSPPTAGNYTLQSRDGTLSWTAT